MAVHETNPERRIQFDVRKRKVPKVDNPVQQVDIFHPNGRSFKSSTSTIPVGAEAHILSDVKEKKNGVTALISVTVEPTHDNFLEMPDNAHYEMCLQFFNRTNRAIRVTTKQNLTFTLAKPSFWNPRQEEYFIVRRLHKFTNASVAQSILFNFQNDHKTISIADDERAKILDRIEEMHRTNSFRNPNARLEIAIDRIIPIALFGEYLAIYVSDLDMMFRQDDITLSLPHPTSQDAILQGELLDKFADHRVSGRLYQIVDNESIYLPRYVCLGDQVFQVPTSRDPGKQPGIYIVDIDNTGIDKIDIKMIHHPLVEANEFGIYPTKEEAMTKGHVNESYKLELAQIERELGKIKAQTMKAESERNEAESRLAHARSMEKIQMERATSYLGHDAQIQELLAKMEHREKQDRLETKASERKDYYEDRSYVRKDSSEVLKWIPTIVTGVLGAAAIGIIKNQKKTVASLLCSLFF